MKEVKTDSMLWLGCNKLLKILIGVENMEMFVDNANFSLIGGWWHSECR